MQNINRIDIRNYLKNIVKAADCYSKVWNRKFNDRGINEKIADLQAIKSFPSYIFLMHYLQDPIDKKVAKKVLDMVAVVMLRRHMTGTSTSYNDDIFARLMRVDFSKDHLEPIKNVLLEYYPDDDEFKDRFPTHELKQRVISRARYVLTKIEYHKTGSTNELSVNSPEDVHVEHVIPQKIDTKKSKKEFGDWEIYLGEKARLNHKKHVNQIGNMTLLAGDLNISASNNPFSRKKKSYRNSNIALTQELSEYQNFRFHHLKKRGEELAEIATMLWKL